MSGKLKKHSGHVKLLSPTFCLMIAYCFVLCVYKNTFANVLVVPEQYSNIQQAIDAAAVNDTVSVKNGTYFENIIINKSGIILEGENPQNTIIYGNHAASVIRTINAENVTVQGFTIAGGKDSFGGGIYSENSVLSIAKNIIKDNEANFGGGIGAKDSNLTITENTIVTNYATGDAPDYGGGIYLWRTSGQIANNTITSNSAYGEDKDAGGGIACVESSPTIHDNTISENSLKGPSDSFGAGLYLYQSTCLIYDNTVSGNSSEADAKGPGGGLCLVESHDCIIYNNLIENNKAQGGEAYGGGIYLYISDAYIAQNKIITNRGLDGGGIVAVECSPTISYNEIVGNFGRWGGGIYGWHMSPAINMNLIKNNNASDGGGGILCDESDNVIIKNNVITENTATNYGGGIDFYLSTGEVNGNIISKNTASQGGGITCTPHSLPAIRDNMIFENNASNAGGGIFCEQSSNAEIYNNILANNQADNYGGAISSISSSPQLINNTIISNSARLGGGIHLNSSNAQIVNNIVVSNKFFGIFAEQSSSPSLSYNDFWSNQSPNTWDDGNYYTFSKGIGGVSLDPKFCNEQLRDYHLSDDSCLRDKGAPEISDKDGSRSDIGAFGGQYQGIDSNFPIILMKTGHVTYPYSSDLNLNVNIFSFQQFDKLSLFIACQTPDKNFCSITMTDGRPSFTESSIFNPLVPIADFENGNSSYSYNMAIPFGTPGCYIIYGVLSKFQSNVLYSANWQGILSSCLFFLAQDP